MRSDILARSYAFFNLGKVYEMLGWHEVARMNYSESCLLGFDQACDAFVRVRGGLWHQDEEGHYYFGNRGKWSANIVREYLRSGYK